MKKNELIFDEAKKYRMSIAREKPDGSFEPLFFKLATRVKIFGASPNELITFIDFYGQQQIFPFRHPRSHRPLITQVNEVKVE